MAFDAAAREIAAVAVRGMLKDGELGLEIDKLSDGELMQLAYVASAVVDQVSAEFSRRRQPRQ